MGLSHMAAAEQAQRLSPSVQVREEPVERGHRRGTVVIDPRRGGDAALRGIPLIGVGAGAISGTAPGGELGQAARLERAGRELVRQRLHRNRFKATREQTA